MPDHPGDEAHLDALLATLPLAAKVRLLSGATAWTTHAEPAIGLRSMVLSDGPVGVRGVSWDERDWGAVSPSPTALAATWDPDLVEQVGAVLGGEAQRKNVDVLLAPTVNLHRTPLGGRHFECLSEDPYLTAQLGRAYVAGVQGRGVAATVKHYVANDSETERMTYRAVIDEQTLHEVYLRPFEDIVAEARPWLVMAAYNAANGPTMTENALLADPLKSCWDFDGVVVSDWNAVRSTVAAANAATDLAMPGPDTPWSGEKLVDAVRRGEVDEAAVDAKVRRLLRLAARVGALGGTAPADLTADRAVDRTADPAADSAADFALLRRAAAAGTVLVRNDGVLPLGADGPLRRIALIGQGATELRIQGGGSAWVSPPYAVSPLAGLTGALGAGVEVGHVVGAVVDTRLRPFTPDQVADPVDGTAGVRVRLHSADGAVWRDEHRDTGRLLWMQHPDVARIAEVHASCVFTAPEDGRYELGVATAGELTTSIDGAVVFTGTVPAASADHLTAVLAPREVVHAMDLRAGEQVRLDARVRPGGWSREIALVVLGVRRPCRPEDEGIAEAAELARGADVAVVVVGTTEQIESEGYDRDSLALPGRQDDLVRAVAAANPRTVVVVNSGAPVELPWLDDVAAVLIVWFPGQEGGHALADVLTGTVEPTGRMPTTWPRRAADCPVLSPVPEQGLLHYAEGVHVGHRGWLRAGADPALPFGSGLGYTSWRFVELRVRAGTDPDGDGVEAVAEVTLVNTGPRAGRQTVQVYLGRAESGVERPERWLAGFAAARAEPGRQVTVDVPVRRRQFAHWSTEAGGWRVEPGTFDVHVGDSVLGTPLRSSWTIG